MRLDLASIKLLARLEPHHCERGLIGVAVIALKGKSQLNKDSSIFNRKCEAGGLGGFLQSCVEHDDWVGTHIKTAHEAFAFLCAGRENDLQATALAFHRRAVFKF